MSRARALADALELWSQDVAARLRHARGSAPEVHLSKVARRCSDWLRGIDEHAHATPTTAERARELAKAEAVRVCLDRKRFWLDTVRTVDDGEPTRRGLARAEACGECAELIATKLATNDTGAREQAAREESPAVEEAEAEADRGAVGDADLAELRKRANWELGRAAELRRTGHVGTISGIDLRGADKTEHEGRAMLAVLDELATLRRDVSELAQDAARLRARIAAALAVCGNWLEGPGAFSMGETSDQLLMVQEALTKP